MTFVPREFAVADVGPKTMAMAETAWRVRGQEVVEKWPIDLRGW